MGRVSTEVPRWHWVTRTIIPAVETSPENFLLNMESVCSQVVPGSDSSCNWESVGTENGSVSFNEFFKMIKKDGGN